MPSIRQNTYPDLMPDFRNLAVMARVLVGVNALALAGTFYAAPAVAPALDRFVHVAAFLEPLLLIELMVLFAVSGLIARLPYWIGCTVVIVIAGVLAGAYHALVRAVAAEAVPSLSRTLVTTVLVASSLMAYFKLHTKAFSPALAEARLQALQARIRPHFLFNSLNAVLSLIRRDPKRAARALEDLRAPGRRDRAPRALRRHRAAAPWGPAARQLGARRGALGRTAAADGVAAAA